MPGTAFIEVPVYLLPFESTVIVSVSTTMPMRFSGCIEVPRRMINQVRSRAGLLPDAGANVVRRGGAVVDEQLIAIGINRFEAHEHGSIRAIKFGLPKAHGRGIVGRRVVGIAHQIRQNRHCRARYMDSPLGKVASLS